MTEAIRVLHVDDEPEGAAAAAEFLEGSHDRFDVTVETSATAGLDRLDDVDCVLSDYRMPRMDGLEFLAAVRENRPDLPFILLTGQGSEEVASEAISAGATDYLRKGTGSEHYDLVANRIENAVESARARERAATLERVRAGVHDVNQALVRASTNEDVERRVCEILTGLAPFRFVVFSGIDDGGTRVEPRTSAGAGERSSVEGFDVTVDAGADGPRTPHERAVHERSVAISTDVRADPAFDRWRVSEVAGDVRAIAVVPVEYDEDLYGLLTLFGNRPRSVDWARDLLVELGDDVAHALYAIDTRRRLEESEARYRTLAETAADAILRIDAESTITYANPAAADLFGYDQSDLRGTALTELMPERLRADHLAGVERYLRTGERRLDWSGTELVGRHRDGTEIPLSVTFGEFERDGERAFTGFIRDVTEREERRAELERQIDYLDEFAGTVAHDLRNPLNLVSAQVELAAEGCDSDYLEDSLETIDRMDDLIEDLLVFAQESQGVDEVEPVVLGDVVDGARHALDTAGATVEADADLGTVAARPTSLRALVENLFRNAVDHAGPDVRIHVTRLADGFAVEDDGPGIPAEDRPDVFEAGYTTADGGTGFGLNIVEKVVEAHGWDVAVADGTDGGARFEITGVDR